MNININDHCSKDIMKLAIELFTTVILIPSVIYIILFKEKITNAAENCFKITMPFLLSQIMLQNARRNLNLEDF